VSVKKGRKNSNQMSVSIDEEAKNLFLKVSVKKGRKNSNEMSVSIDEEAKKTRMR
jgi:hypothetical protein